MKKKPTLSAVLLVLTAGLCWGSIGLFVRSFNRAGLYAMDIVVLRALVTVFFLGLYLLVRDRSLLRIRLKDIWCFAGTGICSMVFFNYCYFSLIEAASMSVAAVMLYTAPAFVIALSAFLFGERITPVRVLALVMTFFGCALVTGVVGTAAPLGLRSLLLGLGAGLGYALYSIFSRYALDRGYHSFTISFYTFVFAAAASLPMTGAGRILSAAFSGPGMAAVTVLCGIVTTVLPYIVYNMGLSGMENGQAALTASVEPVFASLLGFLVFGESLTPSALLGMGLVLSGIVLSSLG